MDGHQGLDKQTILDDILDYIGGQDVLNQKFKVDLPLYVVHDIDSCTGVYLKIWSTLQDPAYANYVVRADLWTNKDGKKFSCGLQDVGIYSTKRMAEEMKSPGVVAAFAASCSATAIGCEAFTGLLEGPGALWAIPGDIAACTATPYMAGMALENATMVAGHAGAATALGGIAVPAMTASWLKNKLIYKSPKWDFINNQRRDLIYRATRGTVEYKQSIGKMNEYLVKVAKERVAKELLTEVDKNPKVLEELLGPDYIKKYGATILQPFQKNPAAAVKTLIDNTKLPEDVLEAISNNTKTKTVKVETLAKYVGGVKNILPEGAENKKVDEFTARFLVRVAEDDKFRDVLSKLGYVKNGKLAYVPQETENFLTRVAKLAATNEKLASELAEDVVIKTMPDYPKLIAKHNIWKITDMYIEREAGSLQPADIIRWLNKTEDGKKIVESALASSKLMDNMKKEVVLLNQLKEKGVISDREYEKTILRMIYGSAADEIQLERINKELGDIAIKLQKGEVVSADDISTKILELIKRGALDPADLANGSKYVDDVLKSKLGPIGMLMRAKVLPKSKTLEGVYEFGQRHPLAMSAVCGAVGQGAGTALVFGIGQSHGIGGIKVGADKYVEVGGSIKDGLWVEAKAGDRGTWVVHVGKS